MPEPQFQRVPGTSLFWLTGSNRTIGFQASPGSSFGDTPALSTTWNDDSSGIYLFLGDAPASDAAFATALLAYLESLGWPYGPRFLWLQDPNVSTWVGQTLLVTKWHGRWLVVRRADFRLHNYTLTVPSGDLVTLATEAQGWGFAFTGDSAPPATFFVPGGQYDANEEELLLPFAGPQAGCWRLSITLSSGAATPSDFERLGVGIRFFYPDTSDTAQRDPFVRAIALPTIVQPATPLRLDVALDSLRATVPDRSWLSFFPLNASMPPFASHFGTARGYPVTVTPLAATGAMPDARLVFGKHPRFVGEASEPNDYYLTLQGAFALGFSGEEVPSKPDTTGSTIQRLLCGASGLEYLGLPAGVASQVMFVPGQPAFAPMAPSSTTTPALTTLGTTAWLWASTVLPAHVDYFAQPEDAPLYRAPSSGPQPSATIGSVFLDYLELPALHLAAPDGLRCFPMAAYRDMDPGLVPAALAVEAAAIAPVRRQAILDADVSAWAAPSREERAPADETSTIGVTPQGLAVGVGADGMQWTWVGIANDTDTLPRQPNLAFTKADGAFRQALETNRFFMVAANDETFMENASVRYQLTADGIAEIRAESTVPQPVLDAVAAWFLAHHYPVAENETAFLDALKAASPDAPQYALVFERKAGLLMPAIGDWRFQLSPRNWVNPQRASRKNALLVFKFNLDRSLAEMTGDVASWAWPDVAAFPGGTVADAQRELQSIYADARDADAKTKAGGMPSPYANFIHVLDDPNWTGIIAFSCDMPLHTLPGPLQALAAGIDPTRFYAHHLGFNVTPYGARPGALQFGKTSVFGLLDYQDPVDQFFEENVAYKFKVLRLTVGFRNSVMTDFSSRVELLVNRFFGTPARLYPSDHGNNVILDGVYQRQQDSSGIEHGTYVFSMERQNTVGLDASALRWVRLLSTQLVTAQPVNQADPAATVVALFQMGGDLYFYEPPEFDPFSFGETRDEEAAGRTAAEAASGLRFGNLLVKMEFTMADRTPSFSFVTDALSFDLSNSTPRGLALYALFPLRLSGFLATPDPALGAGQSAASEGSVLAPDSFGYVSVGAPLHQSKLTDPWYGLVYTIDLGTLGALAGGVGLALNVLVAWSGGGTRQEPAMYVGVKLPGIKDAIGIELPLQGVITLGFKSIQFVASENATTKKRQYLLRFRNFALRFLGLAFPPGYNDILLAGDPDATSPTKLGWYAAYSAEGDPKQAQVPSKLTRLVAARRLPASLLTPRRKP